MKEVLITGGKGFIGSHFIEYISSTTDWHITILNCNLDNEIEFKIDYDIDYVIHFAAKTLVDDSIKNPISFIKTNVLGTAHLFEYIRRNLSPKKIINYGSDEEYGPAPENHDFKEDDRWRPSSPYSASKCGQTAIGMAYATTYGLPIIHTYTSNVFGERQTSNKLIPKTIKSFLEKKPMIIHCKIDNGIVSEIGKRFWLYAKSAASATKFLLENGIVNEHYNISGDIELSNIDITNRIATIMGIENPIYEYLDFHQTRPGHDRRYSLDGSKIKELGWESQYGFEDSLKQTVRWFLDNKKVLYD